MKLNGSRIAGALLGCLVAVLPALAGSEEIAVHMDRLLEHASVAADAAAAVAEAAALRELADAAEASGRGQEAREMLRRATELLGSSGSVDNVRREDPFLRQYLSRINERLSSGASATILARQFQAPRAGRGQRLARHRGVLERVLREEGLPDWLLAVAMVESGFDTAALSPKGALGIWQLMPATAARYGLIVNGDVDERRDPERSTRAAARYLSDLYRLFDDWELALAAYNAGEGRVARGIRQVGKRDYRALAASGVLPAETVRYVPSVLAHTATVTTGRER
jgi:hypothetical protein